MAENLKPAIRFAGFTDAWEQRRLGAIATEVNRNDPTSIAPIMMITANNGFIEQSERYAFNNAGESLKKYILLEKGELAYNHGASKLRPYGSCFALTNEENARIPFVYHCFDVGENDSEFVSIELNGADIEEQLRKIVSSGARMDGLLNISYEEYSNVMLKLPSIREQQTISAFFRSLDHLITLHQRKCDKLSNVKKSMLEKMFPKNGSNVPEIRFAGFTDAWEQRRLSDVVEIGSGMDYKHLGEGNIPVYGTGGYMLSVDEALSYDKDAIGIGRKGTIDKPYILRAPFWTVDTLFYCIPRENYILDFANCLFQTIDWKSKDESTGVPSLSKVIINNVEVMAPTKGEQQKIGAFFNQLDHLITLHQRKLEKLQNIKKSCLEKMFV
ncbi:MAG: restriction endonuclease subunit S [Anaerovoracaceae bacterium]